MKVKSKHVRFQGLEVGVHSPDGAAPHVLFVHGGPGSHSAYFEAAIREFPAYHSGNIGWITYDQRGCGRSDGGELSHAANIADLRALCRHVTQDLGIRLGAILGHSYGGWLAYDVISSDPSAAPRLILAGLGPDFREPRNRSLMMDLFALKLQQPEDYARLYPSIVKSDGEPWRLAKLVREALKSIDLRKQFYWANANAMRWYEQTKSKITVRESDPVYRTVRETLYADETRIDGPHVKKLGVPVLWINGLQDFLMSGLPTASPNLTFNLFKGSGHYPQFEEPEKFVGSLLRFLEVKS